jgi:hypothetical protein
LVVDNDEETFILKAIQNETAMEKFNLDGPELDGEHKR